MKIMRWGWIGVGAGAGYVLGTRAGRERYDSIVQWGRKTAEEFGLTPAVGLVVEQAKSTAEDVRDAAATKSHDLLDNGAGVISERIEAASDHLGVKSEVKSEHAGVTSP